LSDEIETNFLRCQSSPDFTSNGSNVPVIRGGGFFDSLRSTPLNLDMDYFQVIKRVPQALLGRQIKSLRTDYILNQNFVILRKPRKKFPLGWITPIPIPDKS
jgi:hypothetical protein